MSVARYFDEMNYGPAPEADTEARAWLKRHDATLRPLHRRRLREAELRHLRSTRIEPATGNKLARIANGNAADVDAAVAAARKAQDTVGEARRPRRGRGISMPWRALVQRHGRLFAVLESLDNGKPIRETARHRHPAGGAPLLSSRRLGAAAGARIRRPRAGRRRRPDHSVEFPAADAGLEDRAGAGARQHRGAEAGGIHARSPRCCSPRSAAQAGLPPGVLNVVTGEGPTGAAARRASRRRQDRLHRLDRSRPPDPRQDRGLGQDRSRWSSAASRPSSSSTTPISTAPSKAWSTRIWFNQGQVCCAGSRLLVQEGIAEDFLARLKRRMETLRVGHPLDKAIDMGAIVAPVQLKRIQALVQTRRLAKARTVYQPDHRAAQGRLLLPADAASPTCSRPRPSTQEEIFGPVLVAMTFRTPDEAIALANNTRYGLAASVWSETIGLALDVAPKLQAGVVWINATNLFDAAVGFGGYRESGFGREGGREGLLRIPEAQGLGWAASRARRSAQPQLQTAPGGFDAPALDRTAKLFIGGKQARPDGNYSRRHRLARRQAGRRSRRRQPQGHPQRRRGRARRRGLVARDHAQPRADPLLPRREPRRARRRVRRPHRRHDRRVRRQGEGRGRRGDHAPLHLRRLGRQVSKARCIRRRCAAWRWR